MPHAKPRQRKRVHRARELASPRRAIGRRKAGDQREVHRERIGRGIRDRSMGPHEAEYGGRRASAHPREWFAAAKGAGLLDEAIALARTAPADPNTLARAARDMAEKHPAFAVEAGLLALRGFARGDGFDVTSADVLAAFEHTARAAAAAGNVAEVRGRVEAILLEDGAGAEFVRRVIGHPGSGPV